MNQKFTELATSFTQPAARLMQAMIDALPKDRQQLIGAVLAGGGRCAIESAIDASNMTHITLVVMTATGIRHPISELPNELAAPMPMQ